MYGQPAAAGPPLAAYGQVQGSLGGFMAGPAGGAEGPLAPALQALLATLANGSRQAADAHAEAAWKLEGRDLKVGRRCRLCRLSRAWGCSRACMLACCNLCFAMVCVGSGLWPCEQACSKAKKSRRRRSRVCRRSDRKAEGWRRDTALVSVGVFRCQLRRICNKDTSRQDAKAHQRLCQQKNELPNDGRPHAQNDALSGSGQVSTCVLEAGHVMHQSLPGCISCSALFCAAAAWVS